MEKKREGGKKRSKEEKKKIIFFFKQKTAYEIRLSRVGSEMCIRDRVQPACGPAPLTGKSRAPRTCRYAKTGYLI